MLPSLKGAAAGLMAIGGIVLILYSQGVFELSDNPFLATLKESSQEIINKVMPIKSKINCHNQNINEILSKIEEESSKTEDASYDPNILKIYSDEEFNNCVRRDQESIRVNIVPKKYL